MNAKFDKMLKLEDDARTAYAVEAMGTDLATRIRGAEHGERVKAELFPMFDSMTPEEIAAYGEYRSFARYAESITKAL